MEVQTHFYRKERFLRTGVLRGKKFTAKLLQVTVQCQHVDADKRSSDNCKTKPLIRHFYLGCSHTHTHRTQIHTHTPQRSSPLHLSDPLTGTEGPLLGLTFTQQWRPGSKTFL